MTSSVDAQRKAGEAPFYTSLNLNDSANDLFYRPNQHARSPGLERAPLVEQSSPSTPITGRNTVSTNPNDRIDPTSQHVPFIYPPRPSTAPSTPDPQSRTMASGQNPYDPERGQGYPPAVHSNAQASSSSSHEKVHDPNTPLKTHRPPGGSRASSWDLLGGIKKIEQSYEQFDTRNASQSHLVYADGDMPKNKLSKAYLFLLNASIVTRWFLFIVPVLGIIWIPGILSITKFPNARVWAVKLIWWSIWLTVVWAGWWAALAFSRIVPPIIRATLGTVAVGTRRYIEWMGVLHRYIAFFAWSIALWVSWQPLIQNRQVNPGDKSTRAVALIAKILFSLCICSAVLLFEKFAIQWIAGKFHERSYAERIADQKYAVKALVTLYRFSSDVPGRTDVLAEDAQTAKGSFSNPKRVFKKIREGVRLAATTTTTALGNVASEIAGSSVLQPNSPQAIVKTALESANKSRLLARRIFYSFARNRAEYMLVEDIQKYFPTPDEADRVFSLFDKDSNGDASREEVEMALMEFHREQLSIENSMRDLDSAVGRLDNILMSVYVVVALLIFAVALEAQLATIITGAGTLILGLSWLIGGSLQEVLTSIIFLFIKHPFDVGDRVVVNKETYTVKEIRLLSTVFLDGNSISVQAPNSQLNTLFIQNYRRSPQMSETFTFDVSYSTSFEDLERLREKMLEFVTNERRDYQPVFDVNIKDFPEQSKMTLSVDIKYKSNGQIASLKTKRRNKWICALKQALAEVMVYGPTGDPNPPPAVTRYTQVPWDTVLYEDQKGCRGEGCRKGYRCTSITAGWKLGSARQERYCRSYRVMDLVDPTSDVFGDSSEVYMSTPQQERPEPNLLQQRYQQAHAHSTGPSAMPTAYAGMPAPSLGTAGHVPQAQSPFAGGESIELTPRRP
ncbi:hypothetical protein FA13DRAFT_1726059 [Coprinellus micaceus]|uniref:EF-hand domain-containing protein n=1 Tax=Coprinellus micaceus TaxID=71717 RepID=A0A4Y7TXP7_COPMI|nr:hypothetical protein FA13DRAFT_1726059 [Coprinellus micaceus]